MDAELVKLAESASQTFVTTLAASAGGLATTAGRTVLSGLARLLGRGDPARVAAEESALEAAASTGTDPAVLAARWQGRLEALLADHPELAGELTALADSVRSAPGSQTAIAYDNAQQANQHQGIQHNTFRAADDRD
ncbi:MAG TPA: hypothetical protein VGN37_19935 [Actinocatenispora sp.]